MQPFCAAGAAATAAGALACTSGAPHSWQNVAPSMLDEPHDEQYIGGGPFYKVFYCACIIIPCGTLRQHAKDELSV